MSAAPTAFSNQLAKWVRDRSKDSLFFVLVEPKGEEEALAILDKAADLDILSVEEIERRIRGQHSTGFVVEETDESVKILTSAHCIEYVFSRDKPISAEEVRALFRISVICDHYESNFQASRRRNKVRYYNPARASDIDCGKDLLLLHIDRDQILDFSGRRCQQR